MEKTTENSSTILEVDKLTKVIKGKTLVSDISFTVHAGEVFGFLGPNGAGKTTTIRMLVGLIKPTSGQVLIAGHNVRTHFIDAMRNVGCIVENPELYKYLTGWETLKQYARMHGKISNEQLVEIVDQVQLVDRIHDPVKNYSLGMKQRLGIAQALIIRPKLLILDEPTNGLDPAGIKELREFVRRLVKNEGMSVFISSHLLSEIQLMCDRVAIINEGKTITVDTVSSLLHEHSADLVEWNVAPIEQALAILTGSGAVTNVSTDGERILCQIAPTKIPKIIAEMVDNQIQISSVAEKQITLEDLFMQLTSNQAQPPRANAAKNGVTTDA